MRKTEEYRETCKNQITKHEDIATMCECVCVCVLLIGGYVYIRVHRFSGKKYISKKGHTYNLRKLVQKNRKYMLQLKKNAACARWIFYSYFRFFWTILRRL